MRERESAELAVSECECVAGGSGARVACRVHAVFTPHPVVHPNVIINIINSSSSSSSINARQGNNYPHTCMHAPVSRSGTYSSSLDNSGVLGASWDPECVSSTSRHLYLYSSSPIIIKGSGSSNKTSWHTSIKQTSQIKTIYAYVSQNTLLS